MLLAVVYWRARVKSAVARYATSCPRVDPTCSPHSGKGEALRWPTLSLPEVAAHFCKGTEDSRTSLGSGWGWEQ